jgi:hypothetical protein
MLGEALAHALRDLRLSSTDDDSEVRTSGLCAATIIGWLVGTGPAAEWGVHLDQTLVGKFRMPSNLAESIAFLFAASTLQDKLGTVTEVNAPYTAHALLYLVDLILQLGSRHMLVPAALLSGLLREAALGLLYVAPGHEDLALVFGGHPVCDMLLAVLQSGALPLTRAWAVPVVQLIGATANGLQGADSIKWALRVLGSILRVLPEHALPGEDAEFVRRAILRATKQILVVHRLPKDWLPPQLRELSDWSLADVEYEPGDRVAEGEP